MRNILISAALILMAGSFACAAGKCNCEGGCGCGCEKGAVCKCNHTPAK